MNLCVNIPIISIYLYYSFSYAQLYACYLQWYIFTRPCINCMYEWCSIPKLWFYAPTSVRCACTLDARKEVISKCSSAFIIRCKWCVKRMEITVWRNAYSWSCFSSCKIYAISRRTSQLGHLQMALLNISNVGVNEWNNGKLSDSHCIVSQEIAGNFSSWMWCWIFSIFMVVVQ